MVGCVVDINPIFPDYGTSTPQTGSPNMSRRACIPGLTDTNPVTLLGSVSYPLWPGPLSQWVTNCQLLTLHLLSRFHTTKLGKAAVHVATTFNFLCLGRCSICRLGPDLGRSLRLVPRRGFFWWHGWSCLAIRPHIKSSCTGPKLGGPAERDDKG